MLKLQGGEKESQRENTLRRKTAANIAKVANKISKRFLKCLSHVLQTINRSQVKLLEQQVQQRWLSCFMEEHAPKKPQNSLFMGTLTEHSPRQCGSPPIEKITRTTASSAVIGDLQGITDPKPKQQDTSHMTHTVLNTNVNGTVLHLK